MLCRTKWVESNGKSRAKDRENIGECPNVVVRPQLSNNAVLGNGEVLKNVQY
jgi:hypothetical protein